MSLDRAFWQKISKINNDGMFGQLRDVGLVGNSRGGTNSTIPGNEVIFLSGSQGLSSVHRVHKFPRIPQFWEKTKVEKLATLPSNWTIFYS